MFNLPFIGNRKSKIKPYVLVVLDGFGIAPASKGNAITLAKTPNYNRIYNTYPHTELIASGESVGLPANEVGNTEVGHLTMGAGRVILQDLKRINLAIEKGTFYDNRAFLAATSFVKENKSRLHILGLVSTGNVHSSVEHLYALLQLAKKEDISQVYVHAFTDGRDAPPNEGIEMIQRLEERMKLLKLGKVASIAGRYYAMDRDRRWDRTEKAYKAIVLGRGLQANTAIEAMKTSYANGKTDEFVEPVNILGSDGKPITVNENDAVIFFNYRVDRPRQLSMAFVIPDFEHLKKFDFGYDPDTTKMEGEVEVGTTFEREKIFKNIYFVTMTEYHKNLPVSAIAFGPETVVNPMNVILANAGLKQMHMSESEKERFVTYYFDGQREKPENGEENLIVPSPKVATYDKKPEMSLPKLVSEYKKQLRKDKYNFFIINFANPDMVAHTGDLNASIQAIEFVDKYLEELVKATLEVDGCIFITGDHGNAEELITFPTSSFYFTSEQGTVNTDHSNNPVPLIIIDKRFEGKSLNLQKGGLSDIAPTILSLMGITKPAEMTGKNLVTQEANQVGN